MDSASRSFVALLVGAALSLGAGCRHTAEGFKADSKKVLEKTGKGLEKTGQKLEQAGKK